MFQKNVIKKIAKVVGKDRIITDRDELLVYESDGMPLAKKAPAAVIFPESAEEVSAVVKILHNEGIPFVPRGSGTGLSGGCLPVEGGVVIALTRMTKIFEVDPVNRFAVVEPGVINQRVTDVVKRYGLCFAPDPSSGHACTLGGNVAENAGGPHTLKHGVTVNHILGLEMVMPDGKIVSVGGKTYDSPGYDILGVINGSEGTFSIVTKITLKLTPVPELSVIFYAVFGSVDDAMRLITGLLRQGVTPAALELIDGEFIKALRDVFELKFPDDAGAVLFIELDGPAAGMETLKHKVVNICKNYNVWQVEAAVSAEERARLWKARKLAFGAVGRLSTNYITQDGVVPRTKLPEILNVIHTVAKKHGIRIANAFHAGDGNIHPCLMYDERVTGDLEKVKKACEVILRSCVELGGTLSGEHGIGLEKNDYMPWIFNLTDIECFKNLKDVFDPEGLLNPGKVLPS